MKGIEMSLKGETKLVKKWLFFLKEYEKFGEIFYFPWNTEVNAKLLVLYTFCKKICETQTLEISLWVFRPNKVRSWSQSIIDKPFPGLLPLVALASFQMALLDNVLE